MGMPRPSVSTERLTPSLPRSVGFFPVFFPAQRRLGLRPVKTLPPPSDAAVHVVTSQHSFPEVAEHAALRPFLEVAVDGAARPVVAGNRFPLTAGSQHVEDTIH